MGVVEKRNGLAAAAGRLCILLWELVVLTVGIIRSNLITSREESGSRRHVAMWKVFRLVSSVVAVVLLLFIFVADQ